MKVVQVSESEFSVKGHGVHTAYIETVEALGRYTDASVSTNNFSAADIRHIHTVGPYSLLQLLLTRSHKVISAHVVPESFVGSLIGARYWLGLARLYLRWFYNRADLVIAVSDQTKSQLEQLGVSSRIEVLYNMIETEPYRLASSRKAEIRDNLAIDQTAQVVIGNGQIQPRKRFDSFIATARQLPEIKFIWIGGMPFGRVAADRQKMQQLIDRAPDNVTVTGVISIEQVAEYFGAGDVFVMTSEQETFGLAIIEAAAAGLPVVLRNISDYDTTFRANAVMCEENDFAPAIKRLLEDKSYYQNQQRQSAEIAQRFSAESSVGRLIELYESVLSAKSTS